MDRCIKPLPSIKLAQFILIFMYQSRLCVWFINEVYEDCQIPWHEWLTIEHCPWEETTPLQAIRLSEKEKSIQTVKTFHCPSGDNSGSSISKEKWVPSCLILGLCCLSHNILLNSFSHWNARDFTVSLFLKRFKSTKHLGKGMALICRSSPVSCHIIPGIIRNSKFKTLPSKPMLQLI